MYIECMLVDTETTFIMQNKPRAYVVRLWCGERRFLAQQASALLDIGGYFLLMMRC